MMAVFQHRKVLVGFGLIVIASLAAMLVAPRPEVPHQSIPDGFTDSEFWNLVNEFSEPNGYFRSDNFVSNESAFQRVIPGLKKRVQPGGVYVGVGPDQNFTYIVALRPKVAFVVDIRRQNMLLHLMYKALFELSGNRAEFLSRLFARPVPPSLPESFTTEQLFAAFANSVSEQDLAQSSLDDILDRLSRHGFDITPDDSKAIETVYNAFVSAGPEIRYSFPNQYAWRRFPSYAELMLETDGTGEQAGTNHSYMASEENFQAIKRLELENRVIPIVGDFAGEKALRAVGQYVAEHGATISTFYTSNVEFYLFQTEDWRKFLHTVSLLPIHADSVFIRSYFNNYNLQFVNPPSWLDTTPQSYTLTDNMPAFVGAASAGRISNYFDVIRRSKP